MKLKSIVISMVAAGAISGTAFADTTNTSMQSQLDAMKAQIAQMQATINTNNSGTNLPTTGWANRISVGGMLNLDGNVANRSPVQFDEHSPSSIAVNNANLFVDANVSDWTKAHIGVIYSNQNKDFNFIKAGAFDKSQYDHDINVDEAYATIANFAKSPFYFKAGKEYLPFGDYKPYQDITPSFTQMLSQVNDPAAELGFVATNGIHGDVFALQGLQKVATNRSSDTIRNMGLGLGVTNSIRDIAYNVGVQYLANMADVTAIRTDLTSDTNLVGGTGVGQQNHYTDAVGALAANAGLKYKAFDISAKYVSATKRFNVADEIYRNIDATQGAKPMAWGVDAGYSFPVLSHMSRVGLGVQGTREAGLIANANDFVSSPVAGQTYGDYHMAKTRYLADYSVNVSKYTDLGFEVRRDNDYGVGNGGTGHVANTGTVRLAVKFA